LQRARATAIHNKPAYIFFFFLRLIVPEFILLGLVEYGTPKFLGGQAPLQPIQKTLSHVFSTHHKIPKIMKIDKNS